MYIGCFVDDAARDLGAMQPGGASYTFATCRSQCAGSEFLSLQYGGECFCANEYSTAAQYVQVADSLCNMVREPCTSSSHNCGGTWHQAIYQIGTPVTYDSRLTAYWEFGNCGAHGNDHNWGWCGQQAGTCPLTVAVDSSLCASGQANRALWTPRISTATEEALNVDGCSFIYHAQYVCA